MENEFPLENILTITADEYVRMHGKSLSDYVPQGVHTTGKVYLNVILYRLANKLPKGTEAVVRLQLLDEGEMMSAVGTALIPKDN